MSTPSQSAVFSVLDLAPIPQGATARDAFHRSLDLAQHTEKWGYHRYWLAEHHSMTGIASAATSVLLGYLASGTQRIRLGSGGVMLPNHSPLVIAEQFGTLESLYPGRIDLGLGRAPGTDQRTMMALRRHLNGDIEDFPRDVQELQRYFADAQPGQAVQAVPGQGLHVPIWLLGSSLYRVHSWQQDWVYLSPLLPILHPICCWKHSASIVRILSLQPPTPTLTRWFA